MLEENILKSLYNKLSKEKNFNAMAYLAEMMSLQNEWNYLYIDFRKKHELAEELLLSEEKITKEYLDDYSFYLKNCIYRIYDFQNKYALFINSIAQYTKESKSQIKEIFPGWTYLIKGLNNAILSPYKDIIIEANEKTSLKIIAENRYLMTHRKLVSASDVYISPYVLPLGGEQAKNKIQWITESKGILDKAISELEKLFSDTISIILKEE